MKVIRDRILLESQTKEGDCGLKCRPDVGKAKNHVHTPSFKIPFSYVAFILVRCRVGSLPLGSDICDVSKLLCQ